MFNYCTKGVFDLFDKFNDTINFEYYFNNDNLKIAMSKKIVFF